MVLPSLTSMNNMHHTAYQVWQTSRFEAAAPRAEKAENLWWKMGAILCLTAHSFVRYIIPQVSWGVEQKQEKISGSKTMFFFQVSLRIVYKTVKICNPKKSQTKDQCEQYSKIILTVSSLWC
jgi:hypothetical protein